jgi:hypothetical protein
VSLSGIEKGYTNARLEGLRAVEGFVEEKARGREADAPSGCEGVRRVLSSKRAITVHVEEA